MTREVETGSTVDGVPNPNPNLNPTSEVCSAVVPKAKRPKNHRLQAVRCSEFEERTGLAGGGGSSSSGPRAVTEAWGITEVLSVEAKAKI